MFTKRPVIAFSIMAAVLLFVCFAGVSCSKETFGGVGLNVAQLFDPKVPTKMGPLVVLDVLANSPAAAKGVERGDIIVQIDGKATEGRDFNELVSSMKGEKGTTINLTVKRASAGKTLTIAITRGEIDEKSSEAKAEAPKKADEAAEEVKKEEPKKEEAEVKEEAKEEAEEVKSEEKAEEHAEASH